VLHVEAASPENYITKSQLRIYTKQIAHLLRFHYNIGASGPGKDVAVCISSGQILLSAALYGTIAAGGIYSSASSSFTAKELTRQIKQGDAILLITSPDCAAVAKQAAIAASLPLDRLVILDSNNGRRSLLNHAGVDLLSNSPQLLLDWEVVTNSEVLRTRTICLLYSSGTTGEPKGEIVMGKPPSAYRYPNQALDKVYVYPMQT
jgi:4-coumarate--CoA ligase